MKQVLVLLAVLAFFVVAAVLQAQPTCTLQGTVLGSNGEPIPGAVVLIVRIPTPLGTSTTLHLNERVRSYSYLNDRCDDLFNR